MGEMNLCNVFAAKPQQTDHFGDLDVDARVLMDLEAIENCFDTK
jgi:hypothetical protein